nr:Glycosyl transferase family 2 [uncultured bacterium]
MKLSVIVPAYNEEKRIVPTLLDIVGFLESNDINSEILVVDDGSTDATEFVSNETLSKRKTSFKVIRHNENQGKGAAIATGIKNSSGDYIIFIDADGSTQMKELERFYQHIDPTTLLVGSRQIDKNLLLVDQEKNRKILGFLANMFHRIIFRLPVIDSQCGFKLMPKSLGISFIRKPYPKRWGFDMALIHYAGQCGFNIKEIGVQWKDIPGSKVKVFTDSFKTAIELLEYRIKNTFK